MRHFGLFMYFAIVLAGQAAGQDSAPIEKPIWLAVTRPVFVEAINPLAAQRRQDGFEVVVSTETVEAAIAALKRPPAVIVLVGDCAADGSNPLWHLPARKVEMYRWRAQQPPTFVSDAICGDLDGDGTPDIPVGRLPVRDVRQLKVVIDKILSYERRPPSMDDLRLAAWCGTANYGERVEALATGMFTQSLRTLPPAWAQPWAVVGNARHSLCGWPEDQARLFSAQLPGSGMAILIGHGSQQSFYSMNHQGRQIEYTGAMATEMLAKGNSSGPLAIFACSCGDFAGEDQPCLAEALLLAPGGPVAVVAATAESHPLPNYFSSRCLVQSLAGEHRLLGESWLAAQKNAFKARNLIVEAMLKDIESNLEGPVDQTRIRRDHLLLYTLLGDPATRLRLPRLLEVKVQRSRSAQQKLTWKRPRSPSSKPTLYSNTPRRLRCRPTAPGRVCWTDPAGCAWWQSQTRNST